MRKPLFILLLIGILKFMLSLKFQFSSLYAQVSSLQSNIKDNNVDLFYQVDKYNLVMMIMLVINLILFLSVVLFVVLFTRYRVKQKRDIWRKNEEISFINKKLTEQNEALEQEIEKRNKESIFELSQREVVLKQLEISDRNFSTAFYHNPEKLIVIYADDGITADVNEAFLKYFELSEREILSLKLSNLNLGISNIQLNRYIATIKSKEVVKDYLLLHQNHIGQEKWLSCSSRQIKFANRSAFLISFRDVTENYRSLNNYQKLNNLHNILISQSKSFVWQSNLDNEFIYISESVSEILAYHHSELLGKSFYKLMSFYSYKQFNNVIVDLLTRLNSGENPANISHMDYFELNKSDGTNIHCQIFIQLSVNENNEILRFEGVVKDIGFEREIEKSIEKEREIFNKVSQNINDIVLLFNNKDKLTMVSPSVEKILGIKVEQILTTDGSSLFTKESEKIVKDIRTKFKINTLDFQTGKAIKRELDLLNGKGEVVHAFSKNIVLIDEFNNYNGYISIFTDISNNKKLDLLVDLNKKYIDKFYSQFPAMMVIADEENKIISANNKFSEIFGNNYKEIGSLENIILKRHSQHLFNDTKNVFRAQLNLPGGKILDTEVHIIELMEESPKQFIYLFRDISNLLKAEEETSIRKNQFVALSENSPDAILRFNKAIRCIYVNPSIKSNFNIEVEDVIGKRPNDFILNKEVGDNFYNICLKVLIDGVGRHLEFSLEISDEIRHFHCRIEPEFDNKNEVNSVTCVINNVSEYVEVIQKLEINIKQVSFLNNIIASASRMTNIEEIFKSANSVTQDFMGDIEYCGFIIDESGKNYVKTFSNIHSELTERIESEFKNRDFTKELNNKINNREINSNEKNPIYIKIDFQSKELSFRIIPIKSRQDVIGYLVISHHYNKMAGIYVPYFIEESISQELGATIDRIRAEMKHLKSSENYRMLVETTNDLVWSVDRKMNFTFVSDKSMTLLGYETEEMLELSLYDFIGETQLSNIQQFINLNIDQQQKFSFYDVPMIHKNKNLIYVEINAFPIIDESHGFMGYSGTCRDISAQKLNEQLRHSKEIAEKLSVIKQRFVDNVSHEIRTPLNAIVGLTEVMMKQKFNPITQRYINSIQKNSATLLSLVNDILDMSKIESNNFKLHYDFVNSNNFFNDLYASYIELANDKNIDLRININADFPYEIFIDDLRLRQVFNNLISNALKFTKHGFVKLDIKSIPLQDQTQKQGVIIQIEDSGSGIPEDELEKIWDTFVQSSSIIQKKHGGSGLGLGIAKKLVESMNGSIGVKSEIDKGTIFKIILPEIEINNEFKAPKFLKNITNIYSYMLNSDEVSYLKTLFEKYGKRLNILENGDFYKVEKSCLFVSELALKDEFENEILNNFDGRIVILSNKFRDETKSNLTYNRVNSLSEFSIFNAMNKLAMDRYSKHSSHSTSLEVEEKIIWDVVDNQIRDLYKEVQKTNSFNDIEKFYNALQAFAKESGISEVKTYSRDLEMASKSFDIEKISKLIKSFISLKTKSEV